MLNVSITEGEREPQPPHPHAACFSLFTIQQQQTWEIQDHNYWESIAAHHSHDTTDRRQYLGIMCSTEVVTGSLYFYLLMLEMSSQHILIIETNAIERITQERFALLIKLSLRPGTMG